MPSWDGEAEVQALLARLFEDAGFDCTLTEVAPGRPNLIAVRGAGGPFLCSHADTHPLHDHPDGCVEEEGVLVGRGVVDAKGQLAALVTACEAVPDAPVTVVVTCDEEGAGLGSERLELPEPPDAGLVLEPTAFRICHAQAGLIELGLRARTTGGHAYASEGLSALDVLLAAVDALRSVGEVRTTRLHAGEHPWRRPATADADVGVVLEPDADAEAAGADVGQILEALAAAWRGAGVELSSEVRDRSAPFTLDPDALPIVANLQTASGEPLPAGVMTSWTDAENLLHHHGIPCVVFGAGDLASAHSDREQVEIADLVRLARILSRLLDLD